MMKLRAFFTTLILVALPSVTRAQTDLEDAQRKLQGMDISVAKNVTGQNAIIQMAQSLLDRLPYILTILAFAALLYSGGMYVLALGDAQKQETAKKNLTWAIYGMLAMSLVLLGIKIVVYIASQIDPITSIPNNL